LCSSSKPAPRRELPIPDGIYNAGAKCVDDDEQYDVIGETCDDKCVRETTYEVPVDDRYNPAFPRNTYITPQACTGNINEAHKDGGRLEVDSTYINSDPTRQDVVVPNTAYDTRISILTSGELGKTPTDYL